MDRQTNWPPDTCAANQACHYNRDLSQRLGSADWSKRPMRQVARIKRRDLQKIAQALDVTVEFFFDGAKLLSNRRFPLVCLVRDTVRITHPQ